MCQIAETCTVLKYCYVQYLFIWNFFDIESAKLINNRRGFINELIIFRNNHRIVVGGGREAALLVEVPDATKFGALRASAAVGREAMRAQEDV